MRRALTVMVIAAALVVVAFSSTAPLLRLQVMAQGPDDLPTPPPGFDPGNLMEVAQRTIEDASKAVDSANTILGLIEAFGTLLTILLGLIGVLGAMIGFRTFQDLNRTRNRYESEMEKALEKLRSFESRVEENTQQIRVRGDQAIRALTLLQLGKQQMDARNLDAAMATFRQAYTYDPGNRAINYFMGELYIQLNMLDEAIMHLKEAGAEIAEEPERFPAAQAAYAYAWRRKGDQASSRAEQQDCYYRAEGYFREALRHNPGLLDIHGESWSGALGGLYQRQGRIAEAIDAYEGAIRATGSKSSYPFNNLGILHASQRNMVKAREYFEQAVDAAGHNLDDKPHDFWARYDMVTAQIFLGNAEAVRTHLQLAFQTSPTPERLEVFLSGLNRLKAAAPSELLDRVIAAVQTEIERRRGQHEHG